MAGHKAEPSFKPKTLPDKVDANTGEYFPGDYVFNPYSGKKL